MGEDTFDWPPTWRGRVLPRRGGIRVGRPSPTKEPSASLLARRGGRVRAVLARPGQERDVVEEGLRAAAVVTLSHRTLAAEPVSAQTPFGVAVAILAGLAAIPWADRDELDGVADLLVDRYGTGFAARTVAELGGLCVAGAVGQGRIIRRRADDDPPAGLPPAWDGFAARVRRHLGTVSDDVHREVVEALAGCRDGVLPQRAAVSFLVPDQTAWVAADVAASAPQPASGEGRLLLFAVHTVGFDEQLNPYVVDGAGNRRTALPKPGVADDTERAAAATKRFAALKKDVRTAAADQIRRLEQAMVAGRRWPAADFRRYLAGHPLLRHIVARLVWSTDDGATFRVAEDGSYADAADARWSLPDDATVRVVHPVDLGPAVATWAEVFADYEILQPFPQLARETFALTDTERAADRLARWKDRVVPTVTLLGLERKGWRRPEPEDGGMQQWFERPLPGPDRHTLLVVIDPGVVVNAVAHVPEQRIDDVFMVREHDNPWLPENTPHLGTLDAITASELVRDLEEVIR